MTQAQKTVYVELAADTRKLTKGFKEADKKVGVFSKSVKRLGGVLAGVFAGRAVFGALKGTVLDSDKLIKTSRALGVLTDDYERLSFIVEKRLGGSAGTTERLFKFLQVRLGDVGRTYDQYFKQAGLDPTELRKKSSSEQALAVINALSTIENATTRTAIASRLLGEEVSLQVLKVAAAGAASIKDAADDYDRIGSALGKGGASKAIEDLTDETANLDRAWTVLKQTISVEAAPDIITAMQSITNSGAIKFVTGRIVELIGQINELVDNVKWLGDAFDGLDIPPWVKGLQKFTPWNPDVPKTPFDVISLAREHFADPGDMRGALTGPRAKSEVSPNYVINQNNKIEVRDGEQARAVKRQLEKELRAP